MTRYIMDVDTIITVRDLLEIDLNWQKNRDTFSVYCMDRKSIEPKIKRLGEFGIYPKIIEISTNQKYIDIYIHMMQTINGIGKIEPPIIHNILDTIYSLAPPVPFIPPFSQNNLLNISIDRIKQLDMTIDEMYAEYNLDRLLVRIDEKELIRNPVVILLDGDDMTKTCDKKSNNNAPQKAINKIIISKDYIVNDRVLFLLDGFTGIKIQYVPGELCIGALKGSRKNLKKKRDAKKINWLLYEETINVEHDNIIFAVHNRNYQYIEIFNKIYRIKNNTATYLIDAMND